MPVFGVYEVALIAALLGSAVGFGVGVWFVRRQLESKVDSILDFGGSNGKDDVVMDLSEVIEE